MRKFNNNHPRLSENEFHLWCIRPEEHQDHSLLNRYQKLLTEEETKKQQRYMFKKDRHDALITRAFVRNLLSYYTERPAADLRFSRGEKGKPEIIDPPIPLRFNLSHTKNMIICAVTLNNDIGCDVEHKGRKSDVLAIAHRYFSTLETDQLFSLPEAAQRSRFFDYWTLKESYIKACGQGLAIPLGDFSFLFQESSQNNNIQLDFSAPRDDCPEFWQSWLFYPSDEYCIAVSIRDSVIGNKKDKQKSPYQMRFFESTPLVSFKELSASFNNKGSK